MFRLFAALLFLATVPVRAGEEKPAAAPAVPAPKAGSLPADVLGFQGTITGTVDAVDAGQPVLKVKVTAAEPDARKNKAVKPASLVGMTIKITPLAVTDKDGNSQDDPAGIAWLKGARAGDVVTVSIRASSKGEVFRLLKVPSAATN